MWITESSFLLLGSALLEPLHSAGGPLVFMHNRGELIGLLGNLTVFAIVCWFLRAGKNWARWAAYLICVMCLSEVFSLRGAQPVAKTLSTLYDAGLAIYLVWFLTSAPVRAWFLRRTAVEPPRQAI